MSNKAKLSQELRERVQVLADGDPQRLAKRWKIHPDTMARMLAGYDVNRGTLAQVELGLQKEAK